VSTSATLTAAWQIVPAEADGSDCIRCCDPLYLNAHRLSVVVHGREAGPDGLLCDGCSGIVSDSLAGA